ncbi:MAG TPA: CpsD/CapB family tyrosine-protein kinase [Bryobacteraceae bacterium]|nr:CpsD/CapB family tyrosine-protein kinase [Bryobacteraceae bacterium]
MSRVHDALRRAEQLLDGSVDASVEGALVVKDEAGLAGVESPVDVPAQPSRGLMRPETGGLQIDARAFLARCKSIPFRPAPEAHLINPDEPHDGASEEFRSLRTRLNHMQAQQDLRVIVCTSASPAEGKTFTACNLALAQAQLEHPILLADLDLRRPVIHQQFQCERSPGFSDFLLGEKSLEECIRHVEGTNLYVLPAGSAVRNPLELLNMRPVRYTLDSFRKVFNWVILDTPPLLFSADANLLATITDGIILVVRIGSTTYDSVVRAIQTLCENNVLGIVANGARAGELYSKYTYYYTKTEGAEDFDDDDEDDDDIADVEAESAEAIDAGSGISEAPAVEAGAGSPHVSESFHPPAQAGASAEPAADLGPTFAEATTLDETLVPPVTEMKQKSKGGFFSSLLRSEPKLKAEKPPKPAKVKPPKSRKKPVEVDEDDSDDDQWPGI